MTLSGIPTTPAEQERDRKAWIDEIEKLAQDIEGWAAASQWAVSRESKDVREFGLGTYQVPILTIQAPRGRVHVSPVARYVTGAEGRIEWYASPSFSQAVLLRIGGEWRFFSDDLMDLQKGWSRQSFEQVVNDLLSAP